MCRNKKEFVIELFKEAEDAIEWNEFRSVYRVFSDLLLPRYENRGNLKPFSESGRKGGSLSI